MVSLNSWSSGRATPWRNRRGSPARIWNTVQSSSRSSSRAVPRSQAALGSRLVVGFRSLDGPLTEIVRSLLGSKAGVLWLGWDYDSLWDVLCLLLLCLGDGWAARASNELISARTAASWKEMKAVESRLWRNKELNQSKALQLNGVLRNYYEWNDRNHYMEGSKPFSDKDEM